ncbi:MAG: helix-turn-helix domain-containing protein [Clostridia bacterium]|nr:helix-turn-helix domain-containing protein [Clostridia bacterium]
MKLDKGSVVNIRTKELGKMCEIFRCKIEDLLKY